MTLRAIAVTLTVLLAAAVSTLGGQTPPIPAQARLKAFDAQVAPIVARMTLDEKIGQMTQPDHEFIKDPSDVAMLCIGSVLNGGGW